ncbi:MAG: polysaccharide deacetylase family protein, partial [Beijerinckiaceae bacterium]
MILKKTAIDLGFRTLGMTGVPRLCAPRTQGLGAILMLHHVRPWRPRAYDPNRELEVAPEFFDSVLRLLRARGWIIVSMDEAVERIAVGRSDRPFAVLTFDDGYRDNLE